VPPLPENPPRPIPSAAPVAAASQPPPPPTPVRSSFFGNEATGERIVYVIDYSGSMLDDGREALMRSELTRSLTSLPARARYAIVMFMAEAWRHEDSPGHEVRFPDAEDGWLPATNANIARSLEIVGNFTIEKANHSSLSAGTDWGTGLVLALEMQPKPEVVYFMTDGLTDAAVADAARSIDAFLKGLTGTSPGLSSATGETDEELVRRIGRMNAADGHPAIIHAVSLMEPEAARALGILAKENRGTFSIVKEDGTVQAVETP